MNFNVNFIVLLSKYIVHPLRKIKKTDNIKTHGTTTKKKKLVMFVIDLIHVPMIG